MLASLYLSLSLSLDAKLMVSLFKANEIYEMLIENGIVDCTAHNVFALLPLFKFTLYLRQIVYIVLSKICADNAQNSN